MIFRSRLLWTLLAAVAVCLGVYAWLGRSVSPGPAEGTTLDGPPAAEPGWRTLRLATFNIDGGQGADGRVDFKRTVKSLQRIDVISLQEVHATSDSDNDAVTLGELLKLPYLFVPAERRWGHDSFGNAFLTDLPVQRWQRVVLPSDVFHAKRAYLLSDVTWHGRPIHVLTTHVDFKGKGDEQLDAVTAAFLAQPTPAVLMGDLNHPASSPQIQRLTATPGVQECYGSVPELDPVPGRVDWIFVRGMRTVDAGSVDLHASDHPAYWAEVRLDGPATSPASPATRPSSRPATARPPVPSPT